MLKSACVEGGLILKESFNSGESFGNPDLSQFIQGEYFQFDNDSFLSEFKLQSAFELFAKGTSKDPNVLAMRKIAESDGVTLAITEPDSWQERSERYASFCTELADYLDNHPFDVVLHVDRLFSESKGSHGDKGKAMAKELTSNQWEAYKQAKQANGGHPITQTIEQYFSNRSKAGAKKSK